MLSYAQVRELMKDERLPAVIVDLDAFDRNAEKLGEIVRTGKKSLRLATKSVRVPELIRRVLSKGSPYQGLMCFSAEEAQFLRSQGFDDLFVAYPTVRASDLKKLREVHEGGGQVALAIDSSEQLAAIDEQMRGVAAPFRVVIDVDASFRLLRGLAHLGVRRSPVRSAAHVAKLLDEIGAKYPRTIKCVGAMAYEAQVAGLGDRSPFKKLLNPIFKIIRRVSMRSVAKLRTEVALAFAEHKVPIEIFNGGGTGNANWAVNEPVLSELSAGSGLLCSHLFDYYSNIQFEPACYFVLQAVRSSDKGMVSCLGGGYIASGEPGLDRLPIPVLPPGSKLIAMEGAGEVQTPVVLAEGATVAIGDPIVFRHAKAGELAERFSEYLFVSKGKIVGRAQTYRGLGRCFF